MAKKSKSSKKSSGTKASAKKPAVRKAAVKKAGKKPAPKAAAKSGGGEFKVSTGSGASPMELGQQLVALFNQGKADQWIKGVWSPKIESIEGVGTSMGWRGTKAVNAKNAGWMAAHTIHGASAEGPFVGATGFAARFKMDVEVKATGERMKMEEVAIYTVQGGKIVREEFMYNCGG